MLLVAAAAACVAKPCHVQQSHARVAQLDRALASGAKGHRFDSCRVHHQMKTLAEIVVDAGLLSKATATKVGKRAASQSELLVAAFVNANIPEEALYGAMAAQLGLPLLDANVTVDSDGLREVPVDIATRLRALPLEVTHDAAGKVLRVAFADPTDLVAIAELEEASRCSLEVCLMPLSVIVPLIAKHYRGYSTAVVARGKTQGAPNMERTSERWVAGPDGLPRKRKRSALMFAQEGDQEISVTAQVPLHVLRAKYDVNSPASNWRELELRVAALIKLLVAKGAISEAELVQAIVEVADESSE
jgi:Type II secretion system (T2SS), protein E, N-terminal domain